MVSSMAIPKGWRGSDGRSRSEVVQYLRANGGEVVDKQGLTVTHMREALGKGRAITQLLADMEQDGMISREVRGRRTFKITLVDDMGFADDVQAPPARHLRAAPEAGDDLLGANVDLTLLAESLLAIVVKKASLPAPTEARGTDTQGMRQLAQRLRSAESSLEKATKQLRDAREALTESKERVGSLEAQNRALENNLAIMQRELTRKPKGRGAESGVALIDRLDDEGKATLRTLMSQLPETPSSKPRAQARTQKRR